MSRRDDQRTAKRGSDPGSPKAKGQAHFEIRFSRSRAKRLVPRLDASLRLVADGRKRKLLAERSPEESEEEIADDDLQDDLPGLLDE
jgi:hypothetical protein